MYVLYIYIFIYTYICTYVIYIYIYIHIYMYIYISIYMSTYIYVLLKNISRIKTHNLFKITDISNLFRSLVNIK